MGDKGFVEIFAFFRQSDHLKKDLFIYQGLTIYFKSISNLPMDLFWALR